MTAAKYYGVALFQFTPLREGRLGATSGGSKFSINFNSRPSARGDAELLGRHYIGIISIHAPPRGATGGIPTALVTDKFQFTPLREGRRPQIISVEADKTFQFTPLREGRLSDEPAGNVRLLFQFTPLREGRRGDVVGAKTATTFQFTPLREGRQFSITCLLACGYFNSRPSARGDKLHGNVVTNIKQFQFTPLREGRRVRKIKTIDDPDISIHAPPRGAT